ncbi:MAG: hypothetical protein ACEPO2_19925 [Pelagibaca sp.]
MGLLPRLLSSIFVSLAVSVFAALSGYGILACLVIYAVTGQLVLLALSLPSFLTPDVQSEMTADVATGA